MPLTSGVSSGEALDSRPPSAAPGPATEMKRWRWTDADDVDVEDRPDWSNTSRSSPINMKARRKRKPKQHTHTPPHGGGRRPPRALAGRPWGVYRGGRRTSMPRFGEGGEKLRRVVIFLGYGVFIYTGKDGKVREIVVYTEWFTNSDQKCNFVFFGKF